eukprot:UN15505
MERLFIEKKIVDKLLNAWKKHLETTLKFGDPSKCNFGSLVSQAHRDKVESYIKLAKEEGGTIFYGGERPKVEAPFDKGAFIMPTIVTGLSHKSRCATEEVFGPFVAIHPFETEKRIIRNDKLRP